MEKKTGINCVLMRGGTSKGPIFLRRDLPSDIKARNKLLLRIMGSPDIRQINGLGGAHPLTSKVAIVSLSKRPNIDVDYLFLQIDPESGNISDAQNCGNMLAAIGPYAIEKGLAQALNGETTVQVYMLNSDARAELVVQTPGGQITYKGSTSIDGVPGEHAPVLQNYFNTAGAQCGALLPTGKPQDDFMGIPCTLIDNGMPTVLIRAEDVGCSGYETPHLLEENLSLKAHLERIRIWAGEKMNLGNVSEKTVPKMCLIAPPRHGGIITTRTFIPHRVHQSVGVLAAASDAAGCLIENSVAHGLVKFQMSNPCRVDVEHPSGKMTVELEWDGDDIVRTGLIRTASKIMEGIVFP